MDTRTPSRAIIEGDARDGDAIRLFANGIATSKSIVFLPVSWAREDLRRGDLDRKRYDAWRGAR